MSIGLLHCMSAPIYERLKCLRYRHYFITCCRYSRPIAIEARTRDTRAGHYCIYAQRQHFKLKNVSIYFTYLRSKYIRRYAVKMVNNFTNEFI